MKYIFIWVLKHVRKKINFIYIFYIIEKKEMKKRNFVLITN